MSIEFHCTRCNALLRTADDTAGRQAKCPQCEMVLEVPNHAAPPPFERATAPSPAVEQPPHVFEQPLPEVPRLPAIPPLPRAENPFLAPTSDLSPAPPEFNNSGKPIGLATASLVLGIMGLMTTPCMCCFFLPAFIDVLAFVLSLIALHQIKLGRAGGRGMAIAGLIMSLIGLTAVGAFVVFIGFNSM